jgi:hypothetical protein
MLDILFNKIKSYFPTGVKFSLKTVFQSFSWTKKEKNLFWWMAYWTPTYILCTFFNVRIDWAYDNDPLFFFYFAFCGMIFNVWNTNRTADYNFRSPLDFTVFKFNNLLLNLNSIVLEFKKFYLFLINVIFFKSINIISCWYKFFSDKVVFWNPLFKKTSYFSYYRSFSSRFLK